MPKEINYNGLYTFKELHQRIVGIEQCDSLSELRLLKIQHLMSRVLFPHGDIWTLPALKITPLETFIDKYGSKWCCEDKLIFSINYPMLIDCSLETIHKEILKVSQLSLQDKLESVAFALKVSKRMLERQLPIMCKFFGQPDFFEQLCIKPTDVMKFELHPNYTIPWRDRKERVSVKRKRSRKDDTNFVFDDESVGAFDPLSALARDTPSFPQLMGEPLYMPDAVTSRRLDAIDLIKIDLLVAQSKLKKSFTQMMEMINGMRQILQSTSTVPEADMEALSQRADLFQPLSDQLQTCRESCFSSDVLFYENMIPIINLLIKIRPFLSGSNGLKVIYKLHRQESENILVLLGSELQSLMESNPRPPVLTVRTELEACQQELATCLKNEGALPLSFQCSLDVWNLLLRAKKTIESIRSVDPISTMLTLQHSVESTFPQIGDPSLCNLPSYSGIPNLEMEGYTSSERQLPPFPDDFELFRSSNATSLGSHENDEDSGDSARFSVSQVSQDPKSSSSFCRQSNPKRLSDSWENEQTLPDPFLFSRLPPPPTPVYPDRVRGEYEPRFTRSLSSPSFSGNEYPEDEKLSDFSI